MTPFQQAVKDAQSLSVEPGIQMLVTREGVDADELKHYALVKFFSEGKDTLDMIENHDTLMDIVEQLRAAETLDEKIRVFDRTEIYLNWLVSPLEGPIEVMVEPI